MVLPPDLPGCRGVWIHGESGSGKTQWVKNKHGSDKVYQKIANKWWDGYRLEQYPFVCLDDLDPDRAKILTDRLKIWCDKGSFFAEVKGGYAACCP